MGTSAQLVTVGSPQIVIMKQFVLLPVLVSPLTLAEAEAEAEAEAREGKSYGLHHGHGHVHAVAHTVAVAPKCHTVFDTVTREECTTVSEPVCNIRTVTNYETKHEQQCSLRPVEESKAVPKEVPREQCATHTEQQCRNIVEQIPEQQCCSCL